MPSRLLLRLCRTKSRGLQSLERFSTHCPHHLENFLTLSYTTLLLTNQQNFIILNQNHLIKTSAHICVLLFISSSTNSAILHHAEPRKPYHSLECITYSMKINDTMHTNGSKFSKNVHQSLCEENV